VQPRLKGKAHLIRYADDFVILFTHEDDAWRVGGDAEDGHEAPEPSGAEDR
jgi:hypothetical protein